jgi:hypothetical protein
MEPSGVAQEPKPPSPSNRNRVLHLEHTNRSHNVHHEPELHTTYAASDVHAMCTREDPGVTTLAAE